MGDTTLHGQSVTIKPNAWKPGDRFQYYASKATGEIKAGLFLYSAFGMGDLYRADGSMVYCCTTGAYAICHAEGLKYHMIDSFACYQRTYVGD